LLLDPRLLLLLGRSDDEDGVVVLV